MKTSQCFDFFVFVDKEGCVPESEEVAKRPLNEAISVRSITILTTSFRFVRFLFDFYDHKMIGSHGFAKRSLEIIKYCLYINYNKTVDTALERSQPCRVVLS